MSTRLFVEAEWLDPTGRHVRLPRDRAHYLRTVLRLAAGARLTLFDGSGCEYAGVLRAAGPREATVEIVEANRPASPPTAVPLVLGMGLTKGDRLDLVVQKATELGVSAVHPLLTRRAVPRPPAGEAGRLARWRRIAVEAAEQCGRVDLPAIHPIEPLETFLARPFPGALCLCFHEGAARGIAGVEPLREALRPGRDADRSAPAAREASAARGASAAREAGSRAPALDATAAPETVVALIGPEGGFAPEEAEAARAAGFRWVGLGPRILRSETAALAALAVLAYELER